MPKARRIRKNKIRNNHVLMIHKKDKYQISPAKMYEPFFQHAIFLNVYPSFDMENGRGRIIMFQFHEFQRQVKRLVYRKWQQQFVAFCQTLKQFLSYDALIYIYTFVRTKNVCEYMRQFHICE